MNVSAWEVRAIRDGRKTQTRRVVKSQPLFDDLKPYWTAASTDRKSVGKWKWGRKDSIGSIVTVGDLFRCPFGQPGDHLFGRECFATALDNPVMEHGQVVYRATDPDWDQCDGFRWRPSTQMPRWASRIDMPIKSVRIERLQEISEADAIAEGHEEYIPTPRYLVVDENGGTYDIAENYIHGIPNVGDEGHRGKITHIQRYISRTATTAVDAFREQWQYDNGPASWDANPWVWVIEHERITQ